MRKKIKYTKKVIGMNCRIKQYGLLVGLVMVLTSCGGGGGGGSGSGSGSGGVSTGVNSIAGVPASVIGYRLNATVFENDGKPLTIDILDTIQYTFVNANTVQGAGLVTLSTTSWTYSRSGDNANILLNYTDGTESYELIFFTSTSGTYRGASEAISGVTGRHSGLFTITDVVFPTISEVSTVAGESYTFEASETGSIVYGGACFAESGSAIVAGNNTIVFSDFPDGDYSNCTLSIRDDASNLSDQTLNIPAFVIDTTSPVMTPSTPLDFTVNLNEPAMILYGGDCADGDATFASLIGDFTVDQNHFVDGNYNNCTILAEDASGNQSGSITLPPFIVIWNSVLQNDSGVTFGGNYPGGNNAGCSGETIAQQDCSGGRDQTDNNAADGQAGFSFTKLDSNGNSLSSAAGTWSCIRDNVTELIWESKNNGGGIHDRDNTYRWGGTAQSNPFGSNYADWDSLVDGSNTETLCGFSDWRAPTRRELVSLVNFNNQHPALDTGYFAQLPASPFDYWSATTGIWNVGSGAWFVSFRFGHQRTALRTDLKHLRLVRGGN
jgi:hypothetical protein